MEVLVHSSNVRYAMIQASGKQESPERLVLAYEDENCLRDLIAAPSIYGLGFQSREEALANLEAKTSHAAPDLAGGHELLNHRRIAYGIVQSALAAVIVLFYSKNLVSAMIRMALGASF